MASFWGAKTAWWLASVAPEQLWWLASFRSARWCKCRHLWEKSHWWYCEVQTMNNTAQTCQWAYPGMQWWHEGYGSNQTLSDGIWDRFQRQRIHTWYCKPSQKPMTREIIGLAGVMTLYCCLLNGHIIKLPSKYLCLYPWTRMAFNLDQRRFWNGQQLM